MNQDPSMVEKKGRVLCVDDEPQILRSLQWLLQKEFDVVIATSGQDGLALVKHSDFDVVISDQRMPGMTGSEFLREVRKIAPRSMRILLTGYSDLQDLLRSVNESEVFRFINKPWRLDELPRVVAEAALIAQTQPVAPCVPVAHEGTTFDTRGETILVIDDDLGMRDLVDEAVGSGGGNVVHAKNLAEALAVFDGREIGIVVSDTCVGKLDTTRMLRILKQEHPDIVTVVYTGVTDAADVVALINQGQIFRFIPKPIQRGMLKSAMAAAWLKRLQLKENPDYAKRHAVEGVADGTKAALLEDIRKAALASATTSGDTGFFLQRVSGTFRRMFGSV